MVWGFESDCWCTWRGKKHLVLLQQRPHICHKPRCNINRLWFTVSAVSVCMHRFRWLLSDACRRSALTRNHELWLQSQSCVRQRTSHCGWPASGRCPSCRAEDDSTTESARRKGWRLWGLCKSSSPLALGCGADASVWPELQQKKRACACAWGGLCVEQWSRLVYQVLWDSDSSSYVQCFH